MREQTKKYPLCSSPLYRIGTKKRLAEILEIDPKEMRFLQKLGDAAYVRRIAKPKAGKKPREVQDPVPNLKAIHRRLNELMQRIVHPDFVQAGLRNLSYRGNAECHPSDTWVCKIDVKSFYPNCKRERIYQFFRGRLKCSPDVSDLLSDLNTVEGHLPTGGPFSMLLSFWSYIDMFEEIHAKAVARDLKMTLYVDDLTFSGERARLKFLNDEVNPILKTYGLKGHKRKAYPPSKPKLITGVVRTDGESKVPFDRSRKIKSTYEELRETSDQVTKLQMMDQLISRLCEAASIDGGYQEQALKMQDCRRDLLRRHPELRTRKKTDRARISTN